MAMHTKPGCSEPRARDGRSGPLTLGPPGPEHPGERSRPGRSPSPSIGRSALFAGLLALTPGATAAEERALASFTIHEAVDLALRRHPSLQSSAAQEEIRRAQVDVRRAGYLPELDLSIQLNGGSGNVLRGALFPLRNIPGVSGPPTGRRLDDVAFGSLVGVGASWNVLGLAHQMALVDVALAEEHHAHALQDAQRLPATEVPAKYVAQGVKVAGPSQPDHPFQSTTAHA
jgi:outer membrane protein TolC